MLHRVLEQWGRKVHKFRWAVIMSWIAVIAVAGFLAARNSDVLSGGGWDIPESDSLKMKTVLTEQFDGRSGTSLILVHHDEKLAATDPAFMDQLRKSVEFIEKEQGIESVYSPLNAAEGMKAAMIGSDGHTAYAFVNMDLEEDYAINIMPDVQKRLNDFAAGNGVETYLIGASAMWGDVAVYSQEGLAKAEMIVFPLVFLILLIVFRSLMAAITPIIVTVAAIFTGLGLIYFVGSQVEMSVFVTNSALMLGMGVGIDYSLFMVNRFRVELEKDPDVNRAMGVVMRTSGHTVLFSGITVIAAMLALFVINIPAIKAIAFGAVAVVVFAVLASLTLLPAVMAMLGKRINKGRIRLPSFIRKSGKPNTAWRNLAAAIMKRPVIFLFLTILLMLIFTAPIGGMKLNTNDTSILPEESAVRKGYALYQEAFIGGDSSTNTLAVSAGKDEAKSPETLAYLMKLQDELAQTEGVKQVSSIVSLLQGMDAATASAFLHSDPAGWPAGLKPMIDRYISRDGSTAVVDVAFGYEGAGRESQQLVDKIRDEVIPASNPPASLTILLGGDTVQGMEMNEAIYDAILPTLLIMLGLIYLILLVTFRSILLPLKAIIMNLFSVGATFGIVTWVFGNGHGVEIFGATANGYISNFIPLLMLALLFGLSTDYEVFLVSRVKEHYDETGDNEESVAVGLEQTGPLITGAAFLMIAVFTGFAFSTMLPIQTLGFGMAVAILLDASVVRMIIVPAAMKLLGRWNWWLPGRKGKQPEPGNVLRRA